MSVQEHEQLLQLEQATLADVEQYGKCSLKDKVRVQQLTHAIENKLSLIRALTRDLELVVEEADRLECCLCMPADRVAVPCCGGQMPLPPLTQR